MPTARERERKGLALRALASQIRPLIDVIGAKAFDGWWNDESFRRPTTDEWSISPKAVDCCLVS